MKTKLFTLFFALAASVGTMFAEQITVAQALQIAGQLEQGATTADEYEVVGYVTAYEGADADGGWSKYSNQLFWIADEKGTAASNADGALEVYQGVPSEMVYVGDKVSVKATLTNYNGQLETTKRGVVTILEKVERPEQPVVEPADVVISGADFAGQGTANTGSEISFTKDGVTFACDKGYSDDAHSTLRCYKNGVITVTSTGEQIGKLVFQFYDTYTGDLDNEVIVNANEWSYTIPSQARIEKVSIYFGEYEEKPIEELIPITVAEAIEIAKGLNPSKGFSKSTAEKYAVIGFVVGISAANENTFYLADEVDAYDEFHAYKCSSVDREVSEGDIVIVTGRIQHYYGEGASGEFHSYEISGGKLVHFGYTITIIANNGNVTYPLPSDGKLQLTATPDYGYHFSQWSDGNTDNPRAIELTCDTTFTAEFAPNQYTLSLQCDENQGSVEGAGVFDYLAEIQISATPAYGYHFSSWSDGNTFNPRTITLTKDVTLTANFAPNKYLINVSCNAEQGSVKGSGSYTYLSNRTIEATSNYGYHFKQWSDGNTDNPRTIELRQDTAFVAILAVDKYGTCGDNLQLTWRYDTGSQTLTISGEGDLTTNMRYGIEAVKEMRELVIEDGVGVIGNEAFANIKTLNTITLGKDVRKLQDRVFYNCYNLTAIYNYRKTPASATSNTFEEVDKYACTIYVLAGSEDMFRSATGWKDFYSILAIGATETTVSDNKVTVEPSDNSATVTWPVSNEAASYTIDITKDGVLFCRLTFNANGQLTGIAFAPGRDGQSMAPAAVMTATGLQFTVTGLNSGTQYGYSLTAKDANEQSVATYSGSFTTTSEGVHTGIDNTPFLSGEGRGEASKLLRNGEVLIMRGGKTYTIQGVEVK